MRENNEYAIGFKFSPGADYNGRAPVFILCMSSAKSTWERCQTCMTELHSALTCVRAAFFDMDGVIYVGSRPLPGVQELLDYFDASGRRWMLVTNNAALTSQQFSDKVAAMGLRVPPERILGSAEATASWLRHQVDKGWPEAVSYTHLDVYKRQRRIRLRPRHAAPHIWLVNSPAACRGRCLR